MALCKIVLTFVIEKVTEVMIGASVSGIDFERSTQGKDSLKTVRKDKIRTTGATGIKSLTGILFITCLQQTPAKIIICHRGSCLLRYGNLPKRFCFLP